MSKKYRCAQRAFTLLELLIVLAILGLLTAIALPGYQRSVLAGGRAEGRALLLQVAANQERYYADHLAYSSNADPIGNPASVTLTSGGGLYRASVTACPDGDIEHCFVATAVPVGRQVADTCESMSVTHTGLKSATGDSVAECWR